MNVKKYKHVIALLLGSVLTIFFIFAFYNSSYYAPFKSWVISNALLYSAVLIGIKIIGTVWPPIPGGLFTFTAVPLLGWKLAYGVDLIGSILGSSAAFFIAKKWGWNIVHKLFDENAIAKIKKIKIHSHREAEVIFVFRIFGGGVIELVCYAAGLLHIKYRNFLLGTITSHIVAVGPFYYFSGELLSGRRLIYNAVLIVVFLSLFLFFKERYFQFEE